MFFFSIFFKIIIIIITWKRFYLVVSTHCTWTDGLDSNGVNLPTDVLMSEVRSSGRRAHHAPEYLEKRKVDRERRRSSEGGLNTKLRLRRPSRTRKEKEEVSQKSFDAIRLAFVLKGTCAIYRDRAHTHTRTHRIHITHTRTHLFWGDFESLFHLESDNV